MLKCLNMKEIILTENDANQRLDRFLKKYLPKAPLSYIYKLIRKDVKVNGKRAKEEQMLLSGDILAIYASETDLEALMEKKRIHTAKRQFQILYEDENIIVVSKPFGLLVHGDKTEKKDTLANQVTDYLIETGSYIPRLEKSFVPSPVHRLDRNTTGLVIFGKNANALRILSAMLREGPESAEDEARCPLRKFYRTIVSGKIEKTLVLKNRLLKDEVKNLVKVLPKDAKEGKYIETIASPIKSNGKFTLTEIELITGRSHQIRAHLAFSGHPLLGDTKYGGKAFYPKESKEHISTQLLHAQRIEFVNAKEPLDYLNGKVIECPLPQSWIDIENQFLGDK